MLQNAGVLYILTYKCASSHSGVQFFDIWSSKSGPCPSVFFAFWLANVLRATAACNFGASERKLVRDCGVLCILTCKCASRHSRVPFFICLLNCYLRARRFSEEPRIIEKTQRFATFLTFGACGSSFWWLYSRVDLPSADLTSLLCFSTLHIVGS